MKYSEFLELVKKHFESESYWLCYGALFVHIHQNKSKEHYAHFIEDMHTMLKGNTYITTEGRLPRAAWKSYRLYIINRMIGAAKLEEK